MPPWKPGQSGNPGGRPKGAPGFRQRCREVAETLLERLLVEPVEALAAISKAIEVAADRGGYLPVDRLVRAEAERLKSMLDVMASGVDAATKAKFLAEHTQREREVLGEPDAEPDPEPSE
jgi:hypothetical protein